MNYKPPFIPASREKKGSLQERVARARKAREDAAERVAHRYADIKPDKGKWRTGDEIDIQLDPPDIL